jgi:hypothetical protein
VFEETAEAATKEVVQLMSEPDLGVSIEDGDEIIAPHSEPMFNKDLTTYKRQIRHHLKLTMSTH